MTTRVAVHEVVQAPDEAGLLRGAALERPSLEHEARGAPGGWSLDLRGWAVGADQPVEHVEISLAGRVLRRTSCRTPRADLAAERPDVPGIAAAGFYATLGALDLPRPFELRVEAVLADGRQAPIGAVRGTRDALSSSFAPRLRPLMLTGPGRAGSTIFMQMLAGHPDVAVYPPFEDEPRVATYWIDVLRALARPESWMRQITPVGPLNGDWWLGADDPAPRRLRSRPLQEWLAAEGVEDLAAFAQSRVEAVYERIAAAQGRDDAHVFAEKVRNDIVSDLVWELYPDVREVVLVRDPRDVLTSILATIRKRGVQPPPEDPLRWIDADFTARILGVLDGWRRRRDNSLLVRYEDLMMTPRETLAAVLAYAGLDEGADAIEAMLEAAGRRLPGMDEHRTSADAASSIGRWRRDLEPALVEACERSVGEALEAWGYAASTTAAPASRPPR
jgi:Sulfotransferase family